MRNLATLLTICLLLMGCNDKKKRIYPVDGFAVAGQVTYDRVTPSVNFLNSITKTTDEAPVAYAVVQVLDTSDSDKVITEGATNADGVFTIGLPLDLQNSPLKVRVLTVSAEENFPMAVVDQNTPSNVHFIDSELFIGTKNDMHIHITDTPLNGNLPGAFNVFAQIIRGYRFMVDYGGEGGTRFPSLNVFWESGDVGMGVTCFYKRLFQDAAINLQQDEDDDAVILHEFGHYLHWAFSHESSPGGMHIISQTQDDDPRLTWSEGWATAFALMVRKSSYYIDTDNQNFFVEHEYPFHIGQGPVSETVVAAMYLDLYDGSANGMTSKDSDTISITFLQIWNAMKNVRDIPNLTVYDYYLSLTSLGVVTSQSWSDNFDQLGLDETTMIVNSNLQRVFAPVGEAPTLVPPTASPELHAIPMSTP